MGLQRAASEDEVRSCQNWLGAVRTQPSLSQERDPAGPREASGAGQSAEQSAGPSEPAQTLQARMRRVQQGPGCVRSQGPGTVLSPQGTDPGPPVLLLCHPLRLAYSGLPRTLSYFSRSFPSPVAWSTEQNKQHPQDHKILAFPNCKLCSPLRDPACVAVERTNCPRQRPGVRPRLSLCRVSVGGEIATRHVQGRSALSRVSRACEMN